VAFVGLVLRAVVQIRASRAAAALHRALGADAERAAVFERVVLALAAAWHLQWAGLVVWDEDGLGGSLEAVSGTDGPTPPALRSWLARGGAWAREARGAPGAGRGGGGIGAASPPGGDNGALVVFRAVRAPKPPPRHVELALLESLDELGLALAAKPELNGGRA